MPRRKALGRDAGERETGELFHREACRFAEAMDLSIPSFAQHDAKTGRISEDAEPGHLGRPRRAPVDFDARSKARQIAVFDDAGHFGDVNFRRFFPRVEQPEREVAVVGEEQRAGRAEVQPAHRNDARARALQILGDGGAPRRIGHGADDVPRFVEYEIDECLADHGATVDLDAVPLGIRTRPELRDDATVDGDAPVGHQLLRFSARSDAAAGQDLLQAFECHGASAARLAEPRPPAYSGGLVYVTFPR